MPVIPAVSSRVPVLCVHPPEDSIKPDVVPSVDVTAREPESVVCVPVSPTIVTVESFGKSTLAVRVTEIVTVAPANGVLCPMLLTLRDGTITVMGFPPSATPYLSAMSVDMAPREVANDAVPDAAIVGVAKVCSLDGLQQRGVWRNHRCLPK